jgi:hypothetical protein
MLNRELFGNLHEARVILESWRVEYNERRPHSPLDYRTPIRERRARIPRKHKLRREKRGRTVPVVYGRDAIVSLYANAGR